MPSNPLKPSSPPSAIFSSSLRVAMPPSCSAFSTPAKSRPSSPSHTPCLSLDREVSGSGVVKSRRCRRGVQSGRSCPRLSWPFRCSAMVPRALHCQQTSPGRSHGRGRFERQPPLPQGPIRSNAWCLQLAVHIEAGVSMHQGSGSS